MPFFIFILLDFWLLTINRLAATGHIESIPGLLVLHSACHRGPRAREQEVWRPHSTTQRHGERIAQPSVAC